MPDPHWLSPTDPQTCSSTAYSKSFPSLAAPWETRPANVPARSCRTRSTRVLSPIAQCKGVLVCKFHRLTVKARRRLPLLHMFECLQQRRGRHGACYRCDLRSFRRVPVDARHHSGVFLLRRDCGLRNAPDVVEASDQDLVCRRPHYHSCRDAGYGTICVRPIQ